MDISIKNVIVGLLSENCYIVEKNNKCIVIDPGDEPNKIINQISCDVVAIFVTHSHPDHIGALEELKNKYNVPVYKYDNLNEGTFMLEDFKIDVIYTSGHTSDSVTYYFKENEVMFTGDFLFQGSIGRMDLPTGNILEMKKSINKIVKYDNNIKIYPGHGPSTTLGLEKEYNDYLNLGNW